MVAPASPVSRDMSEDALSKKRRQFTIPADATESRTRASRPRMQSSVIRNELISRDLAVLGGTGFLGRHFIAAAQRVGRRVRMLVRDLDTSAADTGIERVPGDLDNMAALERLVTPGCTVVNFAWSGTAAASTAVRQAQRLATVCRAAHVHALLHCSTAAVYGACGQTCVITDDAPPRPLDDYGRTKLAVDEMLEKELDGRVPLILLRPTSVFGPGGSSLIKLATEVTSGASMANYLRSSLFDRRFLHLVPIETAVDAFLFVESRLDTVGRRLLIAADDDPLNRHRPMEQRLMQLFGIADYQWPRMPAPPPLLRLVLRAAGRSQGLPFTRFDGTGLRAAGFRPAVAFDAAVAAFAAWYGTQAGVDIRVHGTGAAS
jgi:nucleoside-diphosphate-sugar epimerase